MEMIVVFCPRCGAEVRAEAEVGREFTCGRCGTRMVLVVAMRPQRPGPAETKDGSWRELRVGPHGRYVGRVNSERGLLEVRLRGETHLVDIS